MALAILCLTVHLDSSANVDYQSRTQLASDGRRWLLDGDPGPRAAVFLLRLLLQEFRCLKSTLGPRLEPKKTLMPFLPASWIFVLKNSKEVHLPGKRRTADDKSVSSPKRFLHSCETFSVAISLHSRKGVREKGPWRAMTLAQRSDKRAIHFTDLI